MPRARSAHFTLAICSGQETEWRAAIKKWGDSGLGSPVSSESRMATAKSTGVTRTNAEEVDHEIHEIHEKELSVVSAGFVFFFRFTS